MCVIQRERKRDRQKESKENTHTLMKRTMKAHKKHNKSNRNMYVQIFEIIRLFLKKNRSTETEHENKERESKV